MVCINMKYILTQNWQKSAMGNFLLDIDRNIFVGLK